MKQSGVKSRRVLYVAKTAKGGSAFSLYHLVKGLERQKYEPIVLFYTQEHTYITDRLAEVGIQTRILGQASGMPVSTAVEAVKHRDIGNRLEAHVGHWSSQTYTFLKACYEFVRQDMPKILPTLRAIQESQADLVHINNSLRFGRPTVIAAWLMQKPCICHVRAFDDLSPFDRLFIRFVDSFIYISRAVAQHYMAQGVSPSKGMVIHNALDLGDYAINPDGVAVRAEFGWPPDVPLVGIVGRLDWWKGHEYFLEATAELARQIPGLKGLVIGESERTPRNWEYYQELLRLTETLGLKERVIFTGFRSDIPRLMSALDVIVLSSAIPEPFGRVIIEGMAAGKPVVATGAGGVLDIIEDGVSGVLVPPKDVAAMAQAILSLLLNREKAERIGRAARQRVEEKFTIQHHVAKVQGAYDAVLNGAQSTRQRQQRLEDTVKAKVN